MYQLEIAKKLTCAAVSITLAADAPDQIDCAIRAALRERKPACIEIACNISGACCAAPGPVSAVTDEEPSDRASLEAAVDAAAEWLRTKRKPVMVIGGKLRAAGAEQEAVRLAEALGCAVTVMAAAEKFLPGRPSAVRRHLSGRDQHPGGTQGRRLVRSAAVRRAAVQRPFYGGLDGDAE